MEVRANLAATRIGNVSERKKTIGLSCDGEIDDVRRPDAILIEQALHAVESPYGCYCRVSALDSRAPVELFFRVHDHEENRLATRDRAGPEMER